MFPCNMSMIMSTCIWAHEAHELMSIRSGSFSRVLTTSPRHGLGTEHRNSRGRLEQSGFRAGFVF